ncbi:response regulator [Spongiibacter sp. KMU-158]|uniref:Response regulator n=1 Tax=Spongiibacter pelagi TaxID=2760804 RepID=A0A927BZC8_9GAMM|nr:response regulator [Spongiibacter pelagi]MBD2858360.1 response regulator [Spongiibacter pelagi]
MTKPLKTALLIDDCEATNFLHQMVLESSGFVEQIVTKYNGKEAIDYLKTAVDGEYPRPELVFLDINMPVMNGWEFLDQYDLLEDNQKAGVVVVMLTTSFNPADEKHAREIRQISNFQNKPLTEEKLRKVIEDCFPGLLENSITR